MSKTKKPKWRKGPPPSIGWWPASACRSEGNLRWWNGEHWSASATSAMNIDAVKRIANTRAIFDLDEIEWTDRPKNWPARSYT